MASRLPSADQRALPPRGEADAFRGLGLERRQALWAVKGLAGEIRAEASAPLLARGRPKETQVELPFMSPAQHVAEQRQGGIRDCARVNVHLVAVVHRAAGDVNLSYRRKVEGVEQPHRVGSEVVVVAFEIINV